MDSAKERLLNARILGHQVRLIWLLKKKHKKLDPDLIEKIESQTTEQGVFSIAQKNGLMKKMARQKMSKKKSKVRSVWSIYTPMGNKR